jgi:hypothetical protein
MKGLIVLFIILMQCNFILCQIDLEYQLHMKSIDRTDTNLFFSNRSFSNYLIEKVLKEKSDSVFISNKSLLKNVPITSVEACQSFSFYDCTLEDTIVLRVNFDDLHGQFSQVTLDINENRIAVPSEELRFYKSALRCEGINNNRPVEVFKSVTDGYFYIYLYGGNNADQWISKLVFDKSRFVCAINVNYYDLSINGCFTENFTWF